MSTSDGKNIDPSEHSLTLRTIIARFTGGQIGVEDFCFLFETTYNLKTEKSRLSPTEANAFSKLFEKVVWYSPFPDERTKIPNYLGEKEIVEAVAAADLELKGA